MRKIKLETWKSNVPVFDKDDHTKIIGSEEKDEDLLIVLNFLIVNKKPEEIPRGLDKFRIFNRISKAFEKAVESKILELEETDYKFLKDEVENSIPSSLGMNESISKAIESFLEAKEE